MLNHASERLVVVSACVALVLLVDTATVACNTSRSYESNLIKYCTLVGVQNI